MVIRMSGDRTQIELYHTHACTLRPNKLTGERSGRLGVAQSDRIESLCACAEHLEVRSGDVCILVYACSHKPKVAVKPTVCFIYFYMSPSRIVSYVFYLPQHPKCRMCFISPLADKVSYVFYLPPAPRVSCVFYIFPSRQSVVCVLSLP